MLAHRREPNRSGGEQGWLCQHQSDATRQATCWGTFVRPSVGACKASVHFWADMSQSKGPIVAEPLLSSRADAIIAADRAGIIRVWTPGAERLSGLDQAPRSH
jgi:PAS domain-containing protein